MTGWRLPWQEKRAMRRSFGVALLLAMAPSPAYSQTVEGSLAGAVGGWSGGGAPAIGGVLGVGVSVTPFTVVEAEASLQGGPIAGGAVGGRVRFGRPSNGRRLLFLAAGLTRLTPFIEPSLSGWHAGGGIEFGADERRSVRFEVRDVVPHGSGSHFWTVRIGVIFRERTFTRSRDSGR
jgi:hypothetical protein